MQATSNVVITNSAIGNGHGISTGSEAAYGVNNLLIQNLPYTGTAHGFRIKTGRDRGAQIYNITFQNHRDEQRGAPVQPQRLLPGIGSTPYMYDVTINGLTATGAKSQSIIEGLPVSCLLRFNLNNVSIATKGKGLALENMTGTFTNVTSTPASGPSVPFVLNENVTVSSQGSTPTGLVAGPGTAFPCSSQNQQYAQSAGLSQ